MFSGHCNIDENVEYASHWLLFSDFEVEVKISQAAEGTLGQRMKNSFPVILGCVPKSSPWRQQTLNQNIEAFWIFIYARLKVIDIWLLKSSLLKIFISRGTKCIYGHVSLLTNKNNKKKAFLSQEWNPMSLLISGRHISVHGWYT